MTFWAILGLKIKEIFTSGNFPSFFINQYWVYVQSVRAIFWDLIRIVSVQLNIVKLGVDHGHTFRLSRYLGWNQFACLRDRSTTVVSYPPNSNDSTIMINKQTNNCQLGNLKFMKQAYCLLGCPSAGPKPIHNSTFIVMGSRLIVFASAKVGLLLLISFIGCLIAYNFLGGQENFFLLSKKCFRVPPNYYK